MSIQIRDRIEVIDGEITAQRVHAIVNAAHETLLGGRRADGAIPRAAGPKLLEECRTLGGCPTGQARITRGYNLAARHVIRTVGPIWRGGQHREDELLASCYRESLALAVRHEVRTIAFPSISTGAYGFPMERAARIAIREIDGFLRREAALEKVWLVCFGAAALETHRVRLAELLSAAQS